MLIAIRTVLLLTLLIASGFTVAGLRLWLEATTSQNSIEEARDRDLLLARNVGSALFDYHSDLVTIFGTLAPRIAIGETTELDPLFANLHFSHVCVVDRSSGGVLGSFFERGQGCPQDFRSDLFQSLRELAAGDDVNVSDRVAPEGEEPRIYLVKKVSDLLVVGVVRTSFFQDVLRQVGSAGHIDIIDRNGQSLARFPGDPEFSADGILTSSTVQRMLSAEESVGTFHLSTPNGEVVARYTRVEGPGWGVIVALPLRELEEAAARANWIMLAVFAVGLMVIIAAALLIATRAARRISMVAVAALETAQGSSDVRVEETGSLLRVRELFYLENGFNCLAAEIAELRAVDSALRADLDQVRTEELQRRAKFESANQSLRDEIAERKLIQALLTKSEARFRNLFECETIAIREEDLSRVKGEIDTVLGVDSAKSFAAFLDKNPQFVRECAEMIVVVDANVATEKLYGIESRPKHFKSINELRSDHDVAVMKKIICAIYAGETQLEFESTVNLADGDAQERYVMVRWSVAAGYEKTYGRVLITSIDITERKIAEERLVQAQKMEAVGQLTGGVAHDFNNLLAVIAGNAELLADAPDVNTSLTDSISRAVLRGSELTQRLLAFSRLQPLRPRKIEVGSLVSSMSELLKRTLGETIKLETVSAPKLWDALADAGQVENALLNLAINARDAMPNGGKLSIECANVQLDNAQFPNNSDALTGDFVVLSVTDSGEGMTPEVLAHACEPFFTTKEVGKGSGLGLSMVYGFAKQSGGNLIISSEPGQGTAVHLFLPRAVQAKLSAVSNENSGEVPRGRGETVLIIEDDEEVRSLATQVLTKLGYRVVDVPDAAKARSFLAKNEHVDIVLSDVILPGDLSGPQFAEEARAARPGLKVIFMSGYSAEAAAREGFLKSDCVLLSKPFVRRQLATALRDQLDADAA